MSYIYNSRIANTGWHLKYRQNLLRALKEPDNFKYIKDIWYIRYTYIKYTYIWLLIRLHKLVNSRRKGMHFMCRRSINRHCLNTIEYSYTWMDWLIRIMSWLNILNSRWTHWNSNKYKQLNRLPTWIWVKYTSICRIGRRDHRLVEIVMLSIIQPKYVYLNILRGNIGWQYVKWT